LVLSQVPFCRAEKGTSTTRNSKVISRVEHGLTTKSPGLGEEAKLNTQGGPQQDAEKRPGARAQKG
jgi:hypothetical protein